MSTALPRLIAGFTPLQRACLTLLASAVGVAGILAAVVTVANLGAAGA